MKKIFGALMIAVCIGMAMPAQAQIHFGVKGGLNLSKASFSNVGDNKRAVPVLDDGGRQREERAVRPV